MQPWRENTTGWQRKLMFRGLSSGIHNQDPITQVSPPFFGKAGTKQDCHLKWPKLTSCLAYHAHYSLLIQFNDWQFHKREKEHALTNDFKKSNRIILGCHHHTLLGGSLSWVSLAFNSWLFSISHVAKSVKSMRKDMKHVHWAMLVDTGPMLLLCPADPFRVTFPSHHVSACNDVYMLKFSPTKGLHGVLHFNSRWKNSLLPQ